MFDGGIQHGGTEFTEAALRPLLKFSNRRLQLPLDRIINYVRTPPPKTRPLQRIRQASSGVTRDRGWADRYCSSDWSIRLPLACRIWLGRFTPGSIDDSGRHGTREPSVGGQRQDIRFNLRPLQRVSLYRGS